MSMKGGHWAAGAVRGVLSGALATHAPAGMEADSLRRRLCSASDLSDVLRGLINDDWSRRIKASRTFWSHRWRLASQPGGTIPAAVYEALPSQLPPREALKGRNLERTVAQFVAALHMTPADEAAARAVFGCVTHEAIAYVGGHCAAVCFRHVDPNPPPARSPPASPRRSCCRPCHVPTPCAATPSSCACS